MTVLFSGRQRSITVLFSGHQSPRTQTRTRTPGAAAARTRRRKERPLPRPDAEESGRWTDQTRNGAATDPTVMKREGTLKNAPQMAAKEDGRSEKRLPCSYT